MLFRWARINSGMRTLVDGAPAPDRSDEYMFYQALISTWDPERPELSAEFAERIRQFMLKAIREKKIHTSWINPAQPYDDATAEFVRRTLIGSHASRFLRFFTPFAQRIAWLGMLNSLSQLVLKIASPGVPDFYQGTELWDLNLVDPDNRRPVDFASRRERLSRLEPLLADSSPAEQKTLRVSEMLESWRTGEIKLYLTAAGLRARRNMPELFLEGAYTPLAAEGEMKDHVVAFARVANSRAMVALVPRLVAGLTGSAERLPLGVESWKQTILSLPPDLAAKSWQDLFTGENIGCSQPAAGAQLSLGEVLRVCPVALLHTDLSSQ